MDVVRTLLWNRILGLCEHVKITLHIYCPASSYMCTGKFPLKAKSAKLHPRWPSLHWEVPGVLFKWSWMATQSRALMWDWTSRDWSRMTRAVTIFLCILTQAFDSHCFLFSLKIKWRWDCLLTSANPFKINIWKPINISELINSGATPVWSYNLRSRQIWEFRE